MSTETGSVAACLAEVRERADWVRKTERSRLADAPYTLGVARRNSARDVRPLLAAVEAALKHHKPGQQSIPICDCGLSYPCYEVQAISRALSGLDLGSTKHDPDIKGDER